MSLRNVYFKHELVNVFDLRIIHKLENIGNRAYK